MLAFAAARPRALLLVIFLGALVFSACSPQKKEIYYCPMHPEYTAPAPGSCPICGMNLVLKETGNLHPEKADSAPPGNEFSISRERQELIGVKTGQASYRLLQKTIRLPAVIAYDPELYQALLDYRQARETAALLKEQGQEIVRTARLRLNQMGISDREIQLLSRRDLTDFIAASGSDPRKKIVYSQLFEKDIADIRVGQKVKLSLSSYPGEIFGGQIIGLGTIVDASNRTLRVRAEVADPKNRLKAQMYANVEIEVNMGKVLSVPLSSVVFGGKNNLVYVQTAETMFSPRVIRTGRQSDQYCEIISGLLEGETVASSGTFLIDSEARLKLGTYSEISGQ